LSLKKENIIKDKTFSFALSVIKICKKLELQNEYVIGRQLKRSGTAPGALVRESEHAESRKDFIHKLSIALKEANETEYWIDLVIASELIEKEKLINLKSDCIEIIKILSSIVKTSKLNGIRK